MERAFSALFFEGEACQRATATTRRLAASHFERTGDIDHDFPIGGRLDVGLSESSEIGEDEIDLEPEGHHLAQKP